MPGPVYQFGDFQLDCGRFELLRNGHSLRVERKPMELLILLASREGQLVLRAEIAQRLWSSEVFVDTEHGINTAIRKLRHLLRDDPEEPKFIQTVTGMGYRFIASITTVEAPSTEAARPDTPPAISGGAAEAPSSGAAPPETKSHRSLWPTLAVSAVVLIAALSLTFGTHPLAARLLRRDTRPAVTSVAVLPLDNLSGDPKQEYFADGMTDELITMLAKNSTLRITSRTSVMQYKGARRPLPEIARALNVDGILEGSISRSNGQVHMTLQLVRADTDTHLFAESYDRSANEVAALPGEAAREIADHLRSSVTPATPARYVIPEAHDAYLRGRYIWFTGGNEEAGKYFRKATELQPDYALGWSGLALYYVAGLIEGGLDPRQALSSGKAAAMRAVQLDDSLPDAHLALGGANLCEWKTAEAEKELGRAIQLDPNDAEAYHLRARLDLALGRKQEALEAARKSMELDPTARPWLMAEMLMMSREYDTAIQEAHDRLETLPNSDILYWVLGRAYDRKGDAKNAIQAYEKMEQVEGHDKNVATIHKAYAQGGLNALWRADLDADSRDTSGTYVSPVDHAALYARLGERERALSLLDEAYRQHSPLLLWIQTDPAFDVLHRDARYRDLIGRLGLPFAN